MHIFYAKKLGRAWHQADCSLNERAESTALVNPSERLSPSSREKSDLRCPSHYPKIHTLLSDWAGILGSKTNLTFIGGQGGREREKKVGEARHWNTGSVYFIRILTFAMRLVYLQLPQMLEAAFCHLADKSSVDKHCSEASHKQNKKLPCHWTALHLPRTDNGWECFI